MIRGGHVDVTLMGALQVNPSGEFASWMSPSSGLNEVGVVGGPKDLAAEAKGPFIAMENTTSSGFPKIFHGPMYLATAGKEVN